MPPASGPARPTGSPAGRPRSPGPAERDRPRAGSPVRIRPTPRPRSPRRTVRSSADLKYCRAMSTAPAVGGEPAESSAGVQSVDRAISVLEILARAGDARVTDVAAQLGVHKSTAF